jgi:hypothetical protein
LKPRLLCGSRRSWRNLRWVWTGVILRQNQNRIGSRLVSEHVACLESCSRLLMNSGSIVSAISTSVGGQESMWRLELLFMWISNPVTMLSSQRGIRTITIRPSSGTFVASILVQRL